MMVVMVPSPRPPVSFSLDGGRSQGRLATDGGGDDDGGDRLPHPPFPPPSCVTLTGWWAVTRQVGY